MAKKETTSQLSTFPLAVKAVFTNVLFFLGVVLLVIGFVRGVNTLVKSVVFEKYPLATYEESQCFYNIGPRVPFPPGEVVPTSSESATPSQTELEEQESKCLSQLEQQRSIKQVEDATISISIFIAGLVLVYFFKGYILEK